MDVGHGGGGETAEWVNALLAAFWSLLQPIVTRFNFALVTAHGQFVVTRSRFPPVVSFFS